MGSPSPQITSCVTYGVDASRDRMSAISPVAMSGGKMFQSSILRGLARSLTLRGIQSETVNTEREQVIPVLSQRRPYVFRLGSEAVSPEMVGKHSHGRRVKVLTRRGPVVDMFELPDDFCSLLD
jgi:hypothetical protein